ncbi:MAG: hypothetical protein LC745_13635, partial [Planctomycetia bacterium]|nr:hypothetical protein [Planctomycetia bacterium]
MNGRAVRISLIRKPLWAVLAAVLPATQCLGGETTGGAVGENVASAVAMIERAYAGRADDPPPEAPPAPLPAANPKPAKRRRVSKPVPADQLPELPAGFQADRPSAAARKRSATPEAPPASRRSRAASGLNASPVRLASADAPPETFPAPPVPSPTPPAVRLATADLPPETFPAPPPPALGGVVDDAVGQAGCTTCGGFHNSADGPAFHASFGCAGGSCVPGQKPCYPPATPCGTVFGQFFSNLYQCLCCPDPCYQPRWVPAANASLFADYARPRTVTRIRYDNLNNMLRPDRNEFFLKQTGPNKRPFPIRGNLYQTDPSAR